MLNISDPENLEEIYVSPRAPHAWIRGVNLGGWLLMERYITPYQFSVTECHLRGDFCWYPGQVDAPSEDSPEYELCDLHTCQPHFIKNVDGITGFPMDEYTLSGSFPDKKTGARWLNYHFENFLKREDLVAIKEAGATHVRIPVPHWMFDEPHEYPGEPWIAGHRWKYFVRAAQWCREIGLQMWPDLHTAPGNQNGFDNCGQFMVFPTCDGWAYNEANVDRTVKFIRNFAHHIKTYGIADVVTGIGLLNEPFTGCNQALLRNYYNRAFKEVRSILGGNMAVYLGDAFDAEKFNDGFWQSEEFDNTFLDSHYYQVFAESTRSLSPRQHIAYTCQKNHREATSCCYVDPPRNRRVSNKGMNRMFGEWSVASDTLVVIKLNDVMEEIAKTGVAPHLDRKLPPGRMEFLKNFALAQMITYEAADLGISRGWFYWTFKMEGGVFAEWDFLRGVREGWLPRMPPTNISTEELYETTCHNLIFRTTDDWNIVHEFPDPEDLPANAWMGDPVNDDVVASHGDSLLKHGKSSSSGGIGIHFPNEDSRAGNLFVLLAVAFLGYAIYYIFLKGRPSKKGYSEVGHSVSV